MTCLTLLIIAAIYWMLAAIFMRTFVPTEWHWLAFMIFMSIPAMRISYANKR
jgi:hypothetical protein